MRVIVARLGVPIAGVLNTSNQRSVWGRRNICCYMLLKFLLCGVKWNPLVFILKRHLHTHTQTYPQTLTIWIMGLFGDTKLPALISSSLAP